MAVSYGFFNAVKDADGNLDRKYNSEQMSQYFKGIIRNGVLKNVLGELVVRSVSGMNISVDPGRAFIDSHWYQSTTAQPLTITGAHATLGRITSVVLHLSYDSRDISLETIDGEYAAEPVAPTVNSADNDFYITLAQVTVAAGVTEVTQADITDTRPDENICGWVTGVIDQIKTETFWLQLEAKFNEWMKKQQAGFDSWFANVKNQLSTDAAGNLQNQIDEITTRVYDASDHSLTFAK